MMSYIWRPTILFFILTIVTLLCIQARPQNSMDSTQPLDPIEIDIGDMQDSYYDLALQQQQQQPHYENTFSSIPLDRLQMLIARYNRPTAYLRSPSVAGINELYRIPESKRQVRYRQCYFNPISCFKK